MNRKKTVIAVLAFMPGLAVGASTAITLVEHHVPFLTSLCCTLAVFVCVNDAFGRIVQSIAAARRTSQTGAES